MKHHKSVDSSDYEAISLRRELELRILLQNVLLMVSVAIFGAIASAAAFEPEAAWIFAAVENVAILAASLQWCHHGIRTAQIKKYLLLIDANESGWERWLPKNRPPSLLGSRWMISTKGVFLGLGLAIVALAVLVSPVVLPFPAAASVGFWIASALFLFTNPKE